jgi:kynureninase
MPHATLDEARALDAQDPLRHHREAFAVPEGLIYLDGNSLGPPPRQTTQNLNALVADQWGRGLIRSWDDAGWLAAPTRIGAKTAPIVGAHPNEVIVADSTSINLFKLLAAALRLRPGRGEILLASNDFPTDRHVADGLAALVPGITVRAVPPADIPAALGPQTAVVLLCHVHYRSGARLDMAALCTAARQAGALTVWDLSHSAGAIPVALNAAGADMAAFCGYKFLNGGPGAPAFLYVARALQAQASSPLQGWIGHADPFGFSDIYAAAPSLSRFLSGTPGILGLTALEAGIDNFLTANQSALHEKSARLFTLFADLAEARCPALHLLTPRDPAHRGSHISFRHPNAGAVMKSLAARNIVGDYRPPDVMRFGLTPLYTSYEEIWLAVEAIAKEVESPSS